jgi:hypothetical protein
VTLTVGAVTYALSVGELDPVRSPTGAAARLHSLGLAPFAVDAIAAAARPRHDALRFGLKLFADQEKIEDEKDDFDALAKKLEDAHGV